MSVEIVRDEILSEILMYDAIVCGEHGWQVAIKRNPYGVDVWVMDGNTLGYLAKHWVNYSKDLKDMACTICDDVLFNHFIVTSRFFDDVLFALNNI